jgi:Flp pilus assembly pilin Flp
METTSLTLFIRTQNSALRLRDRAVEEHGATTVEYIMILGIMALLVTAIFLSSGGLREKILALGTSIKEALGDAGRKM